ncbi:hypothetical protein RJT34_03297 [Clitoria ternatea]|uniref:Uncharacterized protein n=1 Tax=Clitoria ternatea TaxID=43366 RepID=A0AAN9KMQ3_CLITE
MFPLSPSSEKQFIVTYLSKVEFGSWRVSVAVRNEGVHNKASSFPKLERSLIHPSPLLWVPVVNQPVTETQPLHFLFFNNINFPII